MRRLVVLFCLFLLCIQEIYAQQQVSDELRAYNDYLLSLSCYKASGELNMAIGEKFMEGDIAGVRRLSAEREKLLMQSIDSVLAFRADAKKSEAAAQLVTRLVFNLGFENTGKVLNRFEPGFDPLCLQEVRQRVKCVRECLLPILRCSTGREKSIPWLALRENIFFWNSVHPGVVGVRRKFLPSGRLMNGLKIVWCLSPFI